MIDDSGRTLPANPAANRFDGMVTIAFKLPLQVNPQDDPHRIALRFRFMEDSNTRVTQSLEESDASALARASA